MDPEEIISFALKHCAVQVMFGEAGRRVAVSGFDFAKARTIPRGGVISCEWTAQMILALEILTDFYSSRDDTRAATYRRLARQYFDELQKMIITTPSPAGKIFPALPYASAAAVDTGHGWRTPKGDRVGSLAATAYFIFAYSGYNPLQAQFVTNRILYDARDGSGLNP